MLQCTACPEFTKSPFGSASQKQCVAQYRELSTDLVLASGYCTGTAPVGEGEFEEVDYKPITAADRCEEFVDE